MIPNSTQSNYMKDLDQTKCFFQLTIFDNFSKKALFFIPISELPETLKAELYQSTTEEDAIELLKDSKINLKDRIKTWRKHHQCDLYVVNSVSPLKIQNMKTLDFYKKFGSSLLDFLEEKKGTVDLKQKSKKEEKNHETNSTIKITPHGIKTCLLSCSEGKSIRNEDLELQEKSIFIKRFMLSAFAELKSELSKSVNELGKTLSPYEPMNLIWDMLFQAVIQTQPLTDLEKKTLSQHLLIYWEKVHHSLNEVIQCENKIDEKFSIYLKEAVYQLENLPKNIPENLNCDVKKLLKKLEEVQFPLLKLLKHVDLMPSNELKLEFIIQYKPLYHQTLEHWTDCTIYMDHSRSLLRKWLQFRANVIEDYLEINQSIDQQKSLVCIKEIKKAISCENWNVSFQEMNNLVDELQRNSKNNRHIWFAKALLADFNNILLNDKLFQPVSEIAFAQLHKFYKILNTPVSQDKTENSQKPNGSPLSHWSAELRNEGYPELQSSLTKLKNRWEALTSLKKDFINNKDLQNQIGNLLQQLESDAFSSVPELYLSIAKNISKTMGDWEEGLRNLNQHLCKVQDLCFLLIIDPNLPRTDLNGLRKQFISLNERLKELIKPITCFFNAFQQLICIGNPSLQKLPNKANEMNLLFAKEANFSLSLFDTSDNFFKNLAFQIAPLHQSDSPIIFEIEEEVEAYLSDEPDLQIEVEMTHLPQKKVSIQSAPTFNNEQELSEKVIGIFQQNTKTRKVIHDLKQLLAEHNLSFTTKFGKGDHNKLYVNKIPIPLPVHKEWKPGTAKSIQNDILKDLQLVVQQQKKEI